MNPQNVQANEMTQFLFRRMAEECPTWAILIPVLFGFIIVGLVVIFRPENKLITGLIGGGLVSIISVFYLFLGFFLVKHFTWWVILVPILGIAFFYVGMMYIRDARSVHPLWAIFLGLLRTTVYLVLAVVFLMPGCQHFEKQDYESKVVFMFDLSGSMDWRDGIPKEGEDVAALPSRQDEVLKFLAAQQGGKAFMDRVLVNSPVSMYRFGPILDDSATVHLHPKKDTAFGPVDWRKFLKPEKGDIPEPGNLEKLAKEEQDKKTAEYVRRIKMLRDIKLGTNIGGSALQMHKLENNSLIQAIVIISDGQSNVGSDEARLEFLSRLNTTKRTVPVITIGVGQYRVPVSIRVEELYAPKETRPDDKFLIRVPVISTGLNGEPFTATLFMTRIKNRSGQKVVEETINLGAKTGKFLGKGDFQQGQVEYEIELEKIKNIKTEADKDGILEGVWEFKAQVEKHKNEAITAKFHESKPAEVTVQKRKLRVLVFAGGSTREYQFVRSMLYREMLGERMELCVCNQITGKEDHVDQDVEQERMLNDFPTTLYKTNAPGEAKYMSLSEHDVIIAFDPDWTRLTKKQLENLKEWVQGPTAGGIVFVAGPVYTYQISRGTGANLQDVQAIFPVVVKDNRTDVLPIKGGGSTQDTTKPHSLNFSPTSKDFEFLKLDDASDNPIAGWRAFFFNNDKLPDDKAKKQEPRRGFFSYYPVERVKPNTVVAATFNSPEARIGEKSNEFKDEQPFIAVMRAGGQGKTMYLGSGEFWRMRVIPGLHERFWIKVLRHVSTGTKERAKYGQIFMPASAPVGRFYFEAEIKNKLLAPLPATETPIVTVKWIGDDKADKKDKNKDKKDVGEPKGDKDKKDAKQPEARFQEFKLTAKPSDDGVHRGYFMGSVDLKEPGTYEFILPLNIRESVKDPKGGVEVEREVPPLRGVLTVTEPNPEMDNLRTNFGYLYQLSSESKFALDKLPDATRQEIEAAMQVPPDQVPLEGKAVKRLFFPLTSADVVSKIIVPIPPKSDIVKGRYEDLWDQKIPHPGWPEAGTPSFWIFWSFVGVFCTLGFIGATIFLIMGNWQAALGTFLAGVFIGLSPLLFMLLEGKPIDVFWAAVLTPLVVGMIGMVILLILQQWISAIIFSGICGMMSAAVVLTHLIFSELLAGSLPMEFSPVLLVVVSLLGIEWLSRKLLRLA